MAGQVGIPAAQNALSGLQQNGAYKIYDYPFAGTAEQKAAWTAANSQTIQDFFQTQVRPRSEDEHLYNSIGHSAQIAAAQEDDARIGQLAFLLEEEMAIKISIAAKVFADGVGAAGAAEGALIGGAKGISPVVTAEGKIGDAAFTDVNQTARPVAQANPDEPTLIADRVTAKTEATGKSLPNGNMADAHAEIGVIQQAYNAGKTQGADMAMSVAGKDVCGFCKGDIAAAAEKSGLSSLTIQAIDDVTGLPKKYNWVPGMRSIKEVP